MTLFSFIRQSTAVSMTGLLVLMIGCKAEEAQSTGFIGDSSKMTHNATTPFQKTYWNQKYDSKAYDELMVAPVDTHYVMAQNVWESASSANISKDQIKRDVDALAEYTRQSFINAAKNDPKHRFKIVDQAGP